MKEKLVVAVIQTGSRLFDLEATLERLERLTLAGARRGL